MDFQFDHIIHYVKDAHYAQDFFRDKGLNAVYGGRHEQRGTYNTLLHFDLSYIEYLAIDDLDYFEKFGASNIEWSPFSTIAKDEFREGFSRVCLRTQNLGHLAEVFRSKGLLVNGPVSLNRKQPDGNVLEWSLLFVGNPDPKSDLPLPFFIDWGQTDKERKSSLQKNGVLIKHKLDVKRIKYAATAVYNLEETVKKWSEWFELEKTIPEFSAELNATVQELILPGGNLQFAQPEGDGLVKQVLDNVGQRLFALKLETQDSIPSFEFKGSKYIFEEEKENNE